MAVTARATVEDLYRTPGKAELVNGKIVPMCPTGARPGRASANVYLSLRQHEMRVGGGVPATDNVGFLVNLPHRESFSPDAAWYVGPDPGMKFYDGPPAFAVEVRSENDYGPQEERNMAAKRADYFATGTQVVWDVDLLSEEVVRKYTASDPDNPTVYRRDETADAEPAVPGWTMLVDDLFA